MPKSKKITPHHFIVYLVLLVVAVIMMGVLILSDQDSPRVATTQPNSSSTATNYTFAVPAEYSLITETELTKSYGVNDVVYLTITEGITVDPYDLAQGCYLDDRRVSAKFCLDDGSGWGQGAPIVNLSLGGIPAQSFYIMVGVDSAFHIVQTTTDPIVELKMDVAGGGLEKKFEEILESFEFVQ